jgi:hypothetical protein
VALCVVDDEEFDGPAHAATMTVSATASPTRRVLLLMADRTSASLSTGFSLAPAAGCQGRGAPAVPDPGRPIQPRGSLGLVDHYAESFCLLSGSCFRLIQAEDGTGHAQHCPYVTKWRGRFKDNADKWHIVESCQGHRADLDAARRIGGSAPLRTPLSP